MSQQFATGLIVRDFKSFPSGTYGSTDTSWLVPKNEQEERLKEQKALKASLWDLREKFYSFLKSLNQTNHPLCWAFSSTKSVMYDLAAMGMPEVLSGWWTAGVSNGWRNEGGWGAQSTKGLADTGALSLQDVPDFSSKYATAEAKAKAGKRRVIEWYDGSDDRDLNREIMISAFLIGKSPVIDLNWMGHSMAGCYLDSINPLVVYTDNSWDAIDQYGPKGTYKLKDNQAVPDGVVVPRVIQPMD